MRSIFKIFVLMALFGSAAFAKGGFREEYFLIPNGQGIASPSFWDGMNGANPAGMIYNSSLKLQLGAASFDNSTKNLRESGALLYGNSLFGLGLEYSKYNVKPYAVGSAHQVNGALSFRVAPLGTVFGVSAHSATPGASTYDVGMLLEFNSRFHVGGLVQDIAHSSRAIGGGIYVAVHQLLDVVVDAAYQTNVKAAVVKPGLTLHTDLIQLSGAYGFRQIGSQDIFLTQKFSGALGFKVNDNILVEYMYKTLPQHWVGLTLRTN